MLLPIYPGLFPHTVILRRLAEGVDAEGGVVEAPAPSGPVLPCRVKVDRSMPGYGGGQETGMTPAQIAFPHDPGLAKGDRLVYLGRDIRVIAPARRRDGDAVLFVVDGHITD